MLLVKTKIGVSPISGIGLFADQFIPKGALVWKFMPGFDLKIEQEKISILSEAAHAQFLNYAYLSSRSGAYILCFDDARFVNHADAPNIISTYPAGEDVEGITIAARDIQIGEEIFDNYEEFDGDVDKKL